MYRILSEKSITHTYDTYFKMLKRHTVYIIQIASVFSFFRLKLRNINNNLFKLSFQISPTTYTMTSYNLGPDSRPELMEEVRVLSSMKT